MGTRTMRVFHVLGELRASGAEVMLLAAVPLLAEQGIETTIVATGAVPGIFAEKFRAAGVRVIHVPFSKSLRFAATYMRMLRSERPEVLHIHTERANAALAWLARFAAVGAIFRTIHNVFAYSGRLQFVRTIERASLRAIGVRHVAIGASVEQNELHRLRNRTVRIDNWIDSRFRPPTGEERRTSRGALGLAEGDYVISVIGNCSPVKNHGALISALPEIGESLEKRLVCLHAGNDSEGSQEKQQAIRIDDAIEVRFLGPVDNVRAQLWASDAYCMPSLHEGLSIAALEALACGVPSVLAAVSGLKDIHPASVSIKFVKPTADGVVQGFQDLLTEAPEMISRASREAAKTVRRNHGMEAQVQRLVALYRGSRAPEVKTAPDDM